MTLCACKGGKGKPDDAGADVGGADPAELAARFDKLCVAGMGCSTCFPDTHECHGQDIVRCRPDGSGFGWGRWPPAPREREERNDRHPAC